MTANDIQLFPNDDLLILFAAILANFKIDAQFLNTQLNILSRVDHMTGKTIWAKSYEIIYGNSYVINSMVRKLI